MKGIPIYVLFLMSMVSPSCGQSKTEKPKDRIRQHRSGLSESQLKEAAASPVPMSMVRSIRQASNGDILIASYVGVYRYNGQSFTNITRSIEWPTFWDVLEDRNGNLWLASQDSGVYYLPAGKTSLPVTRADFQLFTTRDGLASNEALHIYEDRAGNIWFGASRYDPSTKSFRTFTTQDGFPINHIRLLLEDSKGRLWFGAQGEDLFVYDARLHGEVGQGKTYTVLRNKDGKAFNNVWSVIEDKKGNIWFGADGLWRYDARLNDEVGQGKTFTKVSERMAYAIIQDKKGNIWTTGGGLSRNVWALSRYDAKSLYSEKPEVTEIISGPPALLALFEAPDGSIWFGGLGAHSGVYRYDPSASLRAGRIIITDFKSKEGEK